MQHSITTMPQKSSYRLTQQDQGDLFNLFNLYSLRLSVYPTVPITKKLKINGFSRFLLDEWLI